MSAFSLLIITNIYNDLDQLYASLSYDPHKQWNHGEKLLFSFKTQNTFENDLGITRHLTRHMAISHIQDEEMICRKNYL